MAETVLLVTVGGKPEPIIDSIQGAKPSFTYFLCSGGAKGSHNEVEGILKAVGPITSEIVLLDELDNLSHCYQQIVDLIHQAREAHPSARISASYAGGTKSMAASLAMASTDDPDVELALVTGPREGHGNVPSGLGVQRPVDVRSIRLRRVLKSVQKRLRCFDYPGVEGLLMECISHAQGEPQTAIEAAIAFCRGFDAWDRFDHARAKTLLDHVRPALFKSGLGAYWEAVQSLAESARFAATGEGDPKRPYAVVEELLFNAERRVVQKRFDDAIGRIYRALEATAQIRLRDEHGIDTANVSVEQIPTAFAERLRIGNTKIGLIEAWSLLVDLNDLAGLWYRAHAGQILSFTRWRNTSVAAHGFTAVDEVTYNREGRPTLELLREGLNSVTRFEPAVSQLPDRFSILEAI